MVSRSAKSDTNTLAKVLFQALPSVHRLEKFKILASLKLNGPGWIACPDESRAAFLPASTGAWATYPKLENLFIYNGCGVQPKRTWVIAPDADSLIRRCQEFIHEPSDQKEHLFLATL